ncbi:ribonuclease Z [Oligoflexia bacterium]|nr:ribonuclease Z [Oligoflexia bacterium]
MNELTLLGTGTCQIDPTRMGSSVLIRTEAFNVVYDFGRGVTLRLFEVGLKNDDVEHIILSHLHPDHFSDLIPFLHAAMWSRVDPRTKDLQIYAPAGSAEIMDGIIDLIDRKHMEAACFNVHVQELQSGSFTIGALEFQAVKLPHAENRGLRFLLGGKLVALTGDTPFCEEEVELLEGADLAIIDSGHLSDDELIQLAVLSQAKRIYCSHLYRELKAEVLNRAAKQQGYLGELIVGEDLMQLEL